MVSLGGNNLKELTTFALPDFMKYDIPFAFLGHICVCEDPLFLIFDRKHYFERRFVLLND